MPLNDRAISARQAALAAAVALHGPVRLQPGVDREATIAAAELAARQTADVFAAYLAGTTRIHLTPGPVVDEATGTPAEPNEGENMQLNTGQKVTYTADTEDAAGYDTTETIEWSTNEPTIAVLTVSEDTRSCTVVSGEPGSAVLTARITSLGLEVTEAIDVVPAGTATIELVAGPVENEAAPGEGE
ncbi:hypothetical protein [Streptosporangium roseum]|uniref:hypothetical protein n=1 Tax=Streptosporangium roseum TaxID=2001 RepID=UPI0006924A21|nr:hypothetical protein [Streptosporangium roseum]